MKHVAVVVSALVLCLAFGCKREERRESPRRETPAVNPQPDRDRDESRQRTPGLAPEREDRGKSDLQPEPGEVDKKGGDLQPEPKQIDRKTPDLQPEPQEVDRNKKTGD